MKVGINGMGRIGRLALRAALGGTYRPESDPRAENRLEVVHVNELKGGIAATAHLLEFDSIHGRWHAPIEVNSGNAITIGKNRIGFSEAAGPDEVAWGDLASGLFRPRRQTRDRRRSRQGRGGAQHRGRRQRPALRSGPAQVVDGGILYHELPGPRRQGHPRVDWYPPRTDHHDPRSD
jgi:hypothetical protein